MKSRRRCDWWAPPTLSIEECGTPFRSVAACGAIKYAQIRELFFQIRKRDLEHFPPARVLTQLKLLLHVSTSQQQRVLLALRCGHFW